MSKVKDITGQRFGRLVAIEPTGERSHHGCTVWRCKCDCGNIFCCAIDVLTSNNTRSCGCLQKQVASRNISNSNRNRKNLMGKRSGRLLILEPTNERKKNEVLWKCLCDCGKITYVVTSSLTSQTTRSCGCLLAETMEINHKNGITHNKSNMRLYGVWAGMKNRCYNSNEKHYEDYGGRGIAVCDEWRDDFQAFHDWAMVNGYDENAPRGACTLDRIDVDGNYCPENCRWVDMKIQNNNKRNSKKGNT